MSTRLTIRELQHLERISGRSRLLARLCLGFAVLLALFPLLWGAASALYVVDEHGRFLVRLGEAFKADEGTPVTVNAGLRLAAAAWTAVVLSPLVWAFLQARRCFLGFAAGELFAPRTIGGLRNFALGVLVFLVLGSLAQTGFSVLFHLFSDGPAPGLTLNVAVQPGWLMMALFAGMVMVIAQVLSRASTIAAENEQFV